jgi:AcrR family transcriptional regulator
MRNVWLLDRAGPRCRAARVHFPYAYINVPAVTTIRPVSRQGRPPKVNRQEVVDAAVALADEDGLDAVTIRAVAARLGVAPMTLYGHVASAGELVDLVVSATIAGAVAKQPKRASDGRGALQDFAHGLRGLLLEHPAVLDAYRRRPVQDPTGLAVTAGVVSALVADGLEEDVAISVYATVYAFVIGFVSLETRPVDIDRSALEVHPTLQRMSGRLADLFDRAAFDRGLDALVDAATPRSPAKNVRCAAPPDLTATFPRKPRAHKGQ